MENILKESLKELARVALFAIVGYLITKYSNMPQTEGTIVILAILRWADKFRFEFQKEDAGKAGVTGFKGISGF